MPRPRTQGLQTREKILDVALELFVEQGYDKTSLRDISERLGITKAALYYYFERKEDIFLELHRRLYTIGTRIVEQIEAIEDGPERAAAWPEMIGRLIMEMSADRDLMLMHRRNQTTLAAVYAKKVNTVENQALEARLERILRSAAIPLRQRIRMAAAIGAVTELYGDSGAAFDDVRPEELIAELKAVVSDLMRAEAV